jgi:hypothetical protein
MPNRARAASRPAPPLRSAISAIWAISARTGLPVTTARGSGVPSKATADARAKRARRRLAAPGWVFCSATTSGTRRSTAARPTATLA